MLESENSLKMVVVLLEKSLKTSVYGNFLEKGRVVGGRKKQNVWKGEVKDFGEKEKKKKKIWVRKIKKIKEKKKMRGSNLIDQKRGGEMKEERKVKGVLSGSIVR